MPLQRLDNEKECDTLQDLQVNVVRCPDTSTFHALQLRHVHSGLVGVPVLHEMGIHRLTLSPKRNKSAGFERPSPGCSFRGMRELEKAERMGDTSGLSAVLSRSADVCRAVKRAFLPYLDV